MNRAAVVGRVGVPMFIKVIENAELDFGDLANSRTMTIKLVRNIDYSRFSKGSMVVRYETGSIPTGGTVDVELIPTWPNPAQPEAAFESTAVGATQQLTNTSVVGKVYGAMITAQVGPSLDLRVKGSQPASPSPPTTFKVLISVGILAFE